jgi:3-hydroxyisobutyrate dehydrogenase
MIAFFGMGLLGANFVRALRQRGEAVNVWNRTASKARALEAEGARAFDDAADAARGAERVHLTLSDDAAVDYVLERAKGGIAAGVTIVDHTTTSKSGVAARVQRWADRGVHYQHAPVFMGPGNARDATGIMLVSGDRARFDALQPDLAAMTGKLVYLGAEPDRAAAFKLLGNLFLMCMTTGVVEMIALGRAMGIAPADATSLFDIFNPGQTLPARAKRIVEADFANPSWELAMARKDARLMFDEAARGDATLSLLSAIAAQMDASLADGHATDDWMVIASKALGRR